jgi:CheY-like chemotaxis protein
MDRKRILLALPRPAEAEALRKLLTTSGYEVKVVDNGAAALQLCAAFRPHAVLSELQLQKIDGHHLLRELKSQASTASIPFLLVTKHRSVAERVHSIDLGIDEYITSPFDPEEVKLRIEIILQELEARESTSKKDNKGFSGRLNDMILLDLLQALQIGTKSAFVKVHTERQDGAIFMKNGQLLSATCGDLPPKDALFRMFTWSDGAFRVELRNVDQQEEFSDSTEDLIHAGVQYRDAWHKIAAKLPPLHTRITSDVSEVATLPAAQQTLLQGINGQTSMFDLVEGTELADLEALRAAAILFTQGLLREAPEPVRTAEERQQESGSRANRSHRFADMIQSFLSSDCDAAQDRKIERRRKDRRNGEERRMKQRRLSDYVSQESETRLNRTELLMIREKLANGRSGEATGLNQILSETQPKHADR